MSWLSQLFQMRALRRAAGECADIVPLLRALRDNDYEKAAEIFLEFGSTKDAIKHLPAEVQNMVRVAMPSIWRALDAMIPEENLLRILGILGIDMEA